MRNGSHLLRLLVLAPALAACGSVPTRTFQIDAIDPENEKPLPVLVVVDDDWAGAADRNQYVNIGKKDDSLPLKVTFFNPEVEVTVAQVQVDPDTGKPTRVPKSRSDTFDYLAEVRRLRATDPLIELFILPKR